MKYTVSQIIKVLSLKKEGHNPADIARKMSLEYFQVRNLIARGEAMEKKLEEWKRAVAHQTK